MLCTISDPRELDVLLCDLRRLVTGSGAVLVPVCNPFHLVTASTELSEKQLPPAHDYKKTFHYTKRLVSNGNCRMEVHRSLDIYRRAFTSAGLHIEDILELDGADTRSLRPASDHLVFKLGTMVGEGPRVSLLIKTCLMEWRIIERLIRHQVRQLDEPVSFAEKVVVVDPFEGPYSRQYDDPNPEAHRAAMDRLIEDGVVDRVVYPPQEHQAIRRTYRKWFDIESSETHSKNGQQLFATLYGFDECTGSYVLQIDSDLLIARGNRNHDYLSEMVDVLPTRSPGPFRTAQHLPGPGICPTPQRDPWETGV